MDISSTDLVVELITGIALARYIASARRSSWVHCSSEAYREFGRRCWRTSLSRAGVVMRPKHRSRRGATGRGRSVVSRSSSISG